MRRSSILRTVIVIIKHAILGNQPMRIGIIALLHESNTFVRQSTVLDRFREDMFLLGGAIRESLADSHHEIGGFLAALEADGHAEAYPLVAYRATPGGVITAGALDCLVATMLQTVSDAPALDGLLVAAHGAAVSQSQLDVDGYWLSALRSTVGADVPIIATLDAHANLSRKMVGSCDAMIAYRTNPHLDQRARGMDAARMMVATLRGEIRPTMAAAYPPLVINIERQCTSDAHLRPIYHLADEQLGDEGALSNSILLGFPYADVADMGSATIAVTDDDPSRAQRLATELASSIWDAREALVGNLVDLNEAIDSCASLLEAGAMEKCTRVCLLDMGDNVGGGSAGDGTTLVREILRRGIGPSFACLYDPDAVAACERVGAGGSSTIAVGGKTDDLHGGPIEVEVVVESFHDGRFSESQPRHGGIVQFDQGPTAIVKTVDGALTLMLTSRRIAPFSLRQVTSCRIDPVQFKVLIAKGVHAPIAAYREVCDRFIRVNTIGSTCADLAQQTYSRRRRPLFPFEDCQFTR